MILKPQKKLTPKEIAEIQGLIDHDGWHVPLSKILNVSPDKIRDWEKHGAPSGVAADLWLCLGAKRDNLAAAQYDILIDGPLTPWQRAGQLLSEYEGLGDDPTMIYGSDPPEENRHIVVRVIADLLHYCVHASLDAKPVLHEAVDLFNSETK